MAQTVAYQEFDLRSVLNGAAWWSVRAYRPDLLVSFGSSVSFTSFAPGQTPVIFQTVTFTSVASNVVPYDTAAATAAFHSVFGLVGADAANGRYRR